MASKKEGAAGEQSKSGPSSVKSKNGPGNVGAHQSFRPILPCGNKLLQQRWDQTYYDQHRKLVRAAKPMVDTKAPAKRNHVVSKWKKEQTLKERGEEINRDNMTLLNKMQNIMHTRGCVDHTNSYVHHSLNHEQRQREQVRVARENMELLKRLEEVEPMYKVSEWIDDWQRKEELANMITSFPNGVPTSGLSVTPTTSPRGETSSISDSVTSSISPRSKVSKTTCSTKATAKKKSKVVTPSSKSPPPPSGSDTPSEQKEQNEEPTSGTNGEQTDTPLEGEHKVPPTSQEATSNATAVNTSEPQPRTSSADSSNSSHKSSSASSASSLHSTNSNKEEK